MVLHQLKTRGISSEKILSAFSQVHRHLFVPEAYAGYAYHDRPLPIGEGQTISQPYMVAEMTQLLDPVPGDRVLEIGTGSGYQTAILSFLGAVVYTIERNGLLLENAEKVFRRIGMKNISSMTGDGTIGWEEHAPYDGIIVTAGSPDVPPALLKQLAPGGRLVIPVGPRSSQSLKLYKRTGSGIISSEHGGCVFVPLVGKHGWPAEG
ncbi:MAG: protein-L-isoaspartate(D-aspartate) O-methyltransferase [Elusimicrobia bacterium]|nr:protein-L-isoaspartate(D-aspartate) O-methyltransferase [Elusimicrobiota bacterium]